MTRNPHLVISNVADEYDVPPVGETLLGLYQVQNSYVVTTPWALGEILANQLSNLTLVSDGGGGYLDFGAPQGYHVEGAVYYDYFSTNRPALIVHPDGSVHFGYLKINRMEEDDWGADTRIDFCYQSGVLV